MEEVSGSNSYVSRPTNKEPSSEDKDLVEVSPRWYNEDHSSLASWQIIGLFIEEIDLTTDANIY